MDACLEQTTRRALVAGLLLSGCTVYPAPDLTRPLGPGEVLAGVVTDEAALFGGISAEGRAGDIKIYNDRARFVIQTVRDGDYYVRQGGGIIDADAARPEGQPGRDAVDDWMGMYGLARIADPAVVQVVDSGERSGRAVVVAEGSETPLELATGAVESPDLIPDLGLRIRTVYTLEPDSPLLEVQTTLTATSGDATFAPGDILIASKEWLQPWSPGNGLEDPSSGTLAWTGQAGRRDDLALAILPVPGQELVYDAVADILTSMVRGSAGFGDTVTLHEGESATWHRYYAAGRDLCEITDAWLTLGGTRTESVEGTVTAPDGPVAGARVSVLVDGDPFTLCFTREDGTFSALVPAGHQASWLADGTGPGAHLDLPEGAAPSSAYGAAPVVQQQLRSLVDGAVPVPLAEGRGVAPQDDPLSLQEPAVVTLRVGDGLPFEARLWRNDPPGAPDPRLAVLHDPVLAWARDGEVSFPIEPGSWSLVAHRGIRYDTWQQDLELPAGSRPTVTFDLHPAYTLDRWIEADPHMHSAPSSDGGIPMEDRLITCAGLGIQLHFGTDHDHVADYRPLLQPLGLQDVLGSVVSDEISPVLRGHHNMYPLVPDPSQVNNGAWTWWNDIVDSTEEMYARLRSRHPGAILQVNHPESGLASAAGWSPGVIANPDHWADTFDAVEVLNGGHTGQYVDFYLDLVNHGILAAPVGVSDSHTHTGGHPGFNVTFIGMGTSDPTRYTDGALVEAMTARRTIASRGLFIDMSIDPGSTVVHSAQLEARVLAPEWIHADRLRLLRDGVDQEVAEGEELVREGVSFTLAPETDASYVLIAEGDTPMSPLWDQTPWALSSAILVDVDGDGWSPPGGALQLGTR